MRKFRPPKVSDPPDLVEIHWIDAQADHSDVPINAAGGLVELPSAGYYVRHAKKGPHGPFVVIAMEVQQDSEGVWNCRDHTSIPVAWITRWSVVTEKRQVWPASRVSDTSTQCTDPAALPKGLLDPMTAPLATNAGASPSASEPVKTPSS